MGCRLAVVETVGWVVAVASCGIVFVDWAFVTGWISGCVGCEVFMVWAVCVGWAVVENEGWLVTGAGCDVVIIDWALVIGGISVCVGCESNGLGCRLGSC